MPDQDQSRRNQQVVTEFRARGGKVGGYYAGFSLLLLTTTGASSGQPHTTPLSYLADSGRYIVVAAAGGAPAHPDWYYNLIAHPRVSVEAGTEVFGATAVVTSGQERDALFERFAARYPQLVVYQGRTTRPVPVVALRRREDDGPR